MKKSFIAVLLLVGAAAMMATSVFAQSSVEEPNAILKNVKLQRQLTGGTQGLRVSAGPDPDTVYVGYSQTDHWNASNNYWNVWSGTRRPGTVDATNATWDWDNLSILASHGVGDSLAGWWPISRLYNTVGGFTFSDVDRPWWAVEAGNIANYVMNQGAGGKRTFGVVGVWHGDGGVNQGTGVTWTPLSGTKSAWCGLRQLNDTSVKDLVTNQPFNQAAVERVLSGAAAPGNRRFPGYANQWDQILYRDIAAAAATPLNISFLYRTRMSTDRKSVV